MVHHSFRASIGSCLLSLVFGPLALASDVTTKQKQMDHSLAQLERLIDSIPQQPDSSIPTVLGYLLDSPYDFAGLGDKNTVQRLSKALEVKVLSPEFQPDLKLILALHSFTDVVRDRGLFVESISFHQSLDDLSHLLLGSLKKLFSQMESREEKWEILNELGKKNPQLPTWASYFEFLFKSGLIDSWQSVEKGFRVMSRLVAGNLDGGLSHSWYYRGGRPYLLGMLSTLSPESVIQLIEKARAFPIDKLIYLEEVLRQKIYLKLSPEQLDRLFDLSEPTQVLQSERDFYPEKKPQYEEQMESLKKVFLAEYRALSERAKVKAQKFAKQTLHISTLELLSLRIKKAEPLHERIYPVTQLLLQKQIPQVPVSKPPPKKTAPLLLTYDPNPPVLLISSPHARIIAESGDHSRRLVVKNESSLVIQTVDGIELSSYEGPLEVRIKGSNFVFSTPHRQVWFNRATLLFVESTQNETDVGQLILKVKAPTVQATRACRVATQK